MNGTEFNSLGQLLMFGKDEGEDEGEDGDLGLGIIMAFPRRGLM